jgi:hypothetical protein
VGTQTVVEPAPAGDQDLRLPEREGYQNADSSCRDRIVLVDQAAEEITPLDLWHDRHRLNVALLLRYSKLDAAVRSLGVVGP